MVSAGTAEMLSLGNAVGLVPRIDGKLVTTAVLARWRDKGVKTRLGQRVRLPMLRVGGRWTVEPSKLATFLEAINNDGAEPETSATRTPTQVEKAAQRADNELENMGI